MNTKVYVNDIDNLLQKCRPTVQENQQQHKQIQKTPFAMKQFKTMYNQFLYRKDMNKKYVDETKKIKTVTVTNFDDIYNENYEKWISLKQKEQINLINHYYETKQNLTNLEKTIKLLKANKLTSNKIIYDFRNQRIINIKL